tara:strand:+ start:228 stop:509 length:282 start_codon:yes stop_codon:yes gene_type:complete
MSMPNTSEFNAATILASMRNAPTSNNRLTIQLNNASTVAVRSPNVQEIGMGIPCDFSVKEIFRSNNRIDKEYFSSAGKRFRSIVQVRKAQGTI